MLFRSGDLTVDDVAIGLRREPVEQKIHYLRCWCGLSEGERSRWPEVQQSIPHDPWLLSQDIDEMSALMHAEPRLARCWSDPFGRAVLASCDLPEEHAACRDAIKTNANVVPGEALVGYRAGSPPREAWDDVILREIRLGCEEPENRYQCYSRALIRGVCRTGRRDLIAKIWTYAMTDVLRRDLLAGTLSAAVP